MRNGMQTGPSLVSWARGALTRLPGAREREALQFDIHTHPRPPLPGPAYPAACFSAWREQEAMAFSKPQVLKVEPPDTLVFKGEEFF